MYGNLKMMLYILCSCFIVNICYLCCFRMNICWLSISSIYAGPLTEILQTLKGPFYNYFPWSNNGRNRTENTDYLYIACKYSEMFCTACSSCWFVCHNCLFLSYAFTVETVEVEVEHFVLVPCSVR